MTLYPLLLKPILKHRVWGGRELARLGKALPPGEVIGESWPTSPTPSRAAAAGSPTGRWRGERFVR